jgi:hypothetical protein
VGRGEGITEADAVEVTEEVMTMTMTRTKKR